MTEDQKKHFELGFAIALVTGQTLHDEPQLALDTFKENGVDSAADLPDWDRTEGDEKAIKEIFG